MHDAHASDPATAYALTRLADSSLARTPFGILRDVDRPAYGAQVAEQVHHAEQTSGNPDPDQALAALLHGADTWTIA